MKGDICESRVPREIMLLCRRPIAKQQNARRVRRRSHRTDPVDCYSCRTADSGIGSTLDDGNCLKRSPGARNIRRPARRSSPLRNALRYPRGLTTCRISGRLSVQLRHRTADPYGFYPVLPNQPQSSTFSNANPPLLLLRVPPSRLQSSPLTSQFLSIIRRSTACICSHFNCFIARTAPLTLRCSGPSCFWPADCSRRASSMYSLRSLLAARLRSSKVAQGLLAF